MPAEQASLLAEIEAIVFLPFRNYLQGLRDFRTEIQNSVVRDEELSPADLDRLSTQVTRITDSVVQILVGLDRQGYFNPNPSRARTERNEIITAFRDQVKGVLAIADKEMPIAGQNHPGTNQPMTLAHLELHRYAEMRIAMDYAIASNPAEVEGLADEFNALRAAPATRTIDAFRRHTEAILRDTPNLLVTNDSYNLNADDYDTLRQLATGMGWSEFNQDTLRQIYRLANVPTKISTTRWQEQMAYLQAMQMVLEDEGETHLAQLIDRIIVLSNSELNGNVRDAFEGWKTGILRHTKSGESGRTRQNIGDLLARLGVVGGIRFATDAERQTMLAELEELIVNILPGIGQSIELGNYEQLYGIRDGSDAEKQLFNMQYEYLKSLIKELQEHKNKIIEQSTTASSTTTAAPNVALGTESYEKDVSPEYKKILKHGMKVLINHLVTMDYNIESDANLIGFAYEKRIQMFEARGGGFAQIADYMECIKLLYENGLLKKGKALNLDDVTLIWEGDEGAKNVLGSANMLHYHDALRQSPAYKYVDRIRKLAFVEMLRKKSTWAASNPWSRAGDLYSEKERQLYATDPEYKAFIDGFPEQEEEYIDKAQKKYRISPRDDAREFFAEVSWYEGAANDDRRNAGFAHEGLTRSSKKFNNGVPREPDAYALYVGYYLNKAELGNLATFGGAMFKLPPQIIQGRVKISELAPWTAGTPAGDEVLEIDKKYRDSAIAQEKFWVENAQLFFRFAYGKGFDLDRAQLHSFFLTPRITDLLVVPENDSMPVGNVRTLRQGVKRDKDYVLKNWLTMTEGVKYLIETSSSILFKPLNIPFNDPTMAETEIAAMVNKFGSNIAMAYGFPWSWQYEMHLPMDEPMTEKAKARLKEHKAFLKRVTEFFIMGLFTQIPYNDLAVTPWAALPLIGAKLNEQREIYMQNVERLERIILKYADDNPSFKVWGMDKVVAHACHHWVKRTRFIDAAPETRRAEYWSDHTRLRNEGLKGYVEAATMGVEEAGRTVVYPFRQPTKED